MFFEGCFTRACFNFRGKTKGLYCSIHRDPKMIDVKNKTCAIRQCSVYPYFNYKEKTKGLYCSAHKLPKMVDVKSKICNIEKCKTQARYGYLGNSPTKCNRHSEKDMICYPQRKCKIKNVSILLLLD